MILPALALEELARFSDANSFGNYFMCFHILLYFFDYDFLPTMAETIPAFRVVGCSIKS